MSDVVQHEAAAAARVRLASKARAKSSRDRKVVQAPGAEHETISTADPLRRVLIEAIREADAAKAVVSKQNAGIERLQAQVWQGANLIAAAERNVAKTRQRHAASIARAAASGKEAPTAGPVRAARLQLVDVADEAEANKAALLQLKADLKAAEAVARDADVAIEMAISAILAPVATRLIERGTQLAKQLLPIKKTLSALWCEADRPSQWEAGSIFDRGRTPLKETRAAAADWLRSTNAYERPVPDPFLIARAKLRADPQAKLPPELTALLG
jgi:hypothetical protein